MNKKEQTEILEKIDLYIRGNLSQDEIDELWKLFLQHPGYYELFETEVHLKSLIRKGKRPGFDNPPNPNNSSFQTYRRWIYAAAAAVILVIGVQFFSMDEPGEIRNYALAEIDQSNLIGADVLRSNNQAAENTDVLINNALAVAYDGDTARAIELFRDILNQPVTGDQKARVQMNLGILLYNSGDFEQAMNHFLDITGMEEIPEYQLEKSLWFLGNTYLNLDQPHEAREAFFQTYNLNGRFQSEALSLLEKLDRRLGNYPNGQEPARLGE